MTRFTAALLIASLAIPSLALAADATGAAGTAIELEINHSTAEIYLQYHGRVVLTDGTRSYEYRWGGTSCSNKILPADQVTMLQRAMESGTPIVPRFQSGQGTNKCLVGFKLVAP